MSNVERLEAAIAKLVKLKEESTPGPWRTDGPAYHFYGEEDGDFFNTSTITGHDRAAVFEPYPPPKRTEQDYREWLPLAEADISLTLVLHRTIDTQLAFLREAHFQLTHEGEHVKGFLEHELNLFMRLADEILLDN